MLSYRKHPNGLQVLTYPLAESKSVTVLVLFKVGSRHETKQVSGASHFIEHLMFKGTKKRPSTLDISRELDSVGAEFNAFTGKDHTGYYIKLAADKIDMATDILSDILYNSIFKSEEINRERGVIIEEINMYDDNPLMLIGDLFEQQIFGNQPLGWSIAGPRSVIRKISRADLLGYHDAHYLPSNMVVAVAGKVPQDIQARIEHKFVRSKKAETAPAFAPVEEKQGSKKMLVKHRNVAQVQLALGTKAYAYEHPLLPALTLLSIILGGNMSSRLFINIRERRGLAYHVHAEAAAYQDSGVFAIQAGLDRRRMPAAITGIMEELRDVKAKGVTPAELNKAKEFIRGKMTLGWEDSNSIAEWFGKQQLLIGKTRTMEEWYKKIAVVTNDDIKQVAGELFQTNRLRGVCVGPVTDGKSLEKLITV